MDVTLTRVELEKILRKSDIFPEDYVIVGITKQMTIRGGIKIYLERDEEEKEDAKHGTKG